MVAVNILLGLSFAYLLLGICAEDDAAHRKDMTYAAGFVTTLIIALNVFG